jgi:hypothetical protein
MREVAAAQRRLYRSWCSLNCIPWALRSLKGLKEGKNLPIWRGQLWPPSREQRPQKGPVGELHQIHSGNRQVIHDNGSFLPVRPRYRREVDGQRLSAKADDKVCCFSPVRRSMTYQMSCFLPERLQDMLLLAPILYGKKYHCQSNSSNCLR